MADVHNAETRSRNMAAIRDRDTRPELRIRHALHARGFRFRLHVKSLPGSPDIVFPKYKAVVFVNGCFWHEHHCHLFRWPKTRRAFWRDKIKRNSANDAAAINQLINKNWRVATVWECSIKGRSRLPTEEIIASLEAWLQSDEELLDIGAGINSNHETVGANRALVGAGQDSGQ